MKTVDPNQDNITVFTEPLREGNSYKLTALSFRGGNLKEMALTIEQKLLFL